MGLDMYLNKKTYVKYWEHNGDDNYEIIIKKHNKIVKEIDPKKISEITEQVMYWRKANAIHKWFVDNVQNGEDDCKEYYVSIEKLKELRDVCENVLIESQLVEGIVENGQFANAETKGKLKPNLELGKVIKDYSYADKHLPTASGFFFGGTNYDEWYYNDVKETLLFLNEELKKENREGYYYQSSW